MQRLPTVKQLQYLLALAEHSHFGVAAKSCFVSQSAFSIAIKDLEELLGIQLFERTNRSVHITQAGLDISARARTTLSHLHELQAAADALNNPLARRLDIGVIPTIAPFLMPPLLPGLQKTFPELQMFFREDQTDRLYSALMARELDLVLLALPYELPGTNTMTLLEDRFYLAHKAKSRWLDGISGASLELGNGGELPREAVLLLEDGHCLRDHALSACDLIGMDASASLNPYAATSIYTLLQLVAQDLGVTFLPEIAVNSPLIKASNLKVQALPAQSHRTLGLVWRQESAFSDDYKKLGQAIIDLQRTQTAR